MVRESRAVAGGSLVRPLMPHDVTNVLEQSESLIVLQLRTLVTPNGLRNIRATFIKATFRSCQRDQPHACWHVSMWERCGPSRQMDRSHTVLSYATHVDHLPVGRRRRLEMLGRTKKPSVLCRSMHMIERFREKLGRTCPVGIQARRSVASPRPAIIFVGTPSLLAMNALGCMVGQH